MRCTLSASNVHALRASEIHEVELSHSHTLAQLPTRTLATACPCLTAHPCKQPPSGS